jgi:hypothetical protein
MSNKSIIAVALGTALISPLAQGNAGTGRTSAGFGAPAGLRGIWHPRQRLDRNPEQRRTLEEPETPI